MIPRAKSFAGLIVLLLYTLVVGSVDEERQVVSPVICPVFPSCLL